MPARHIGVQLIQEITSLTSTLVRQGMVDDQNVVGLFNSPGQRWSVQQPGSDMSLALRKQPYAMVYDDMARSGNYTLHMLDGALIQFAYSGAKGNIERHRLAYLPAPDLEPYQNDPELYFGESHFIEVVGHQVMPVPVRFDFDARDGVAKDQLHPVSHVTLGQYRHCRVPVTRAMMPAEFLTFILQSFYSTPDHPQQVFASAITTGSRTITTNEAAAIHVVLP